MSTYSAGFGGVPGQSAATAEEPATDTAAVAALEKRRKANPQKTVDAFWERFTTKSPGHVSTVLPENLYAKRAAAHAPKGVVPGHNAVASFDEAAETCRIKVEKIAKECRRVNQKYRDVHFDIELDLKYNNKDCLNGLLSDEDAGRWPRSAKRVGEGDCWFMAALCTLSNMQDLIQKICVASDELVGVYGFVFHRDGEWISTIIDDKLYLTKPDYEESFLEKAQWDDIWNRVNGEEEYRKAWQTGSGALYFAQCSDRNETWLPLLEKAYAKAHGDYEAIEGGFVGEAIEDLTGGVTTELLTSDILDKEKFWNEEVKNVNKDFLFGCYTGLFGGWGERRGVIEGHAYSIMKTAEIDGERLCLLRNPWGHTEWNGPWSDGSKEWTPDRMQKLDHRFGDDGMFWISYKDLLEKFQNFDRTRLIGPEWSVAQQWTTLHVAWSVDYHDTKFRVNITKPGPVVIVLSQLDDRYFRGLEGQYYFELQFRIHEEGSDEYIVRSHGKYIMRRSVSTEIDLDPGHYTVLIKVIAERDRDKLPPEEAIRKTCREKRDKLLQVGLSFDLAHAKGQIKESDAEKKEREAREAKKKDMAKEKKKKKIQTTRDKRRAMQKKMRERQRQLDKKKAEVLRKRKESKAKEGKKAQDNAEADVEVTKTALQADSEQAVKASDTTQDSGLPVNVEVTKEDETSDTGPKERSNSGYPTPTGTPSTAAAEGSPETPKETSKETPKDASTDEPANADKPAETPPEKPTDASAEKSADTEKPTDTAPEKPITPSIELNGVPSAAPSVAAADDGASAVDDGNISDSNTEILEFIDQFSDLESVSSTATEAPEADATAQEDDEFAKDPWNAVCIVGLRMYTKDKDASVEVVRPKEADTEAGLDLDDSAADATKEGREPTEVEANATEAKEAADASEKEKVVENLKPEA
ncbi:MAG: hypothetical protein M1833_000794 [Piccolia ochrophora]|nr:MAG: hypothetical protein M1833_000794 [Piccolia ochrophora]